MTSCLHLKTYHCLGTVNSPSKAVEPRPWFMQLHERVLLSCRCFFLGQHLFVGFSKATYIHQRYEIMAILMILFWETIIFHQDLWKDWHESIVFDEDSYVSTYSRFLSIFFLYSLLWDLGACNGSEQQTWGKKVQQPKLNSFISGCVAQFFFINGIFVKDISQEIQQSNNKRHPWSVFFWPLGYGIFLHGPNCRLGFQLKIEEKTTGQGSSEGFQGEGCTGFVAGQKKAPSIWRLKCGGKILKRLFGWI